MAQFVFPAVPADEPGGGGGGGAVTIDDQPISVDVSGGVTLDAGDIEIGAVEIKDGATNTRAVVRTDTPDPADAALVVRVLGSASGGLTDAELRASAVPVLISDGSGPVTVDGAVSVSNFPAGFAVSGNVEVTNDVGNPLPVSGTIEITNDVGNPIPVNGTVTITDGSGPVTVDGSVAVTSVVAGVGATNLGKAEDAAHTSGDTGVMPLAVRNDAGGALAGTTGDYIPLTTDASGNLRVVTTGTQATQDYDTSGGTVLQPTQGVVVPSATGPLAITGDATGLDVDVNHVTPGVAATDLGKAEDAAHASGDTGVMPLAVRNDAGGALAGTNGDYIPLTTDANGNLRVVTTGVQVTQDYDTSGGTSLQPTQGLVVPSATGPVPITGDAANGLDIDVTRWTDARLTTTGALGALNDALTLNATNLAVALFVWPTAGTLSGTVTFEGSWDNGVTWDTLVGKRQDASTSVDATATTSAGTIWLIACAGFTNVRVRVSAYTSGTSAAFLNGSQFPSITNSAINSITNGVIPGVTAGNLGKAEDAVHSDGDTGVMSLAVRNDAGGALAGTTGDYIPLTTDALGQLRATIGATANGIAKAEDAVHATGDVGVPALGRRIDTEQSSAGSSGDYVTIDTDSIGRTRVVSAPNPVTATLANVTNSTSSVTLIAANAARRGWVITNDGNQPLFVKLGTTASATSYTYVIPAATASQTFSLEMPPGLSYQGDITGIQSSANGTARTTELVAA